MKALAVKLLPKLSERRCKACGTCVKACPERAIEIRGFRFSIVKHEHASLAYPERCTHCGKCVKVCPEGAWRL